MSRDDQNPFGGNKMFGWKKANKKSKQLSVTERIEQVKQNKIPNHIAIIMDGNGRWARKRALPRVAGHHEGMKVVRKTTKLANELGVKVLTVYAFSTENWKRPKDEVDYLLKLPEQFLGTFLPELMEENVKVQIMGDQEKLPLHTVNAVSTALEQTKDNDGLILNFALNYGSRSEILEGVRKAAEDLKTGRLDVKDLTEDRFSDYLMTKQLMDPDLLIRTSGEIRLSNFMLWQLAYTEFYFTDVLWPDFDDHELLDAIEEFQGRSRRFGGV